MSADNQPNQPRKFNFKTTESEILVFTRQHLDAVFSGILSNMAVDRLGYRVTENTQFRLSPDFTSVEIWERDPNETAQQMNGSGIKTA